MFITGASRGFGREIALSALEHSLKPDIDFILCATNSTALEETKSDLLKWEKCRDVLTAICDFSNPDLESNIDKLIALIPHQASFYKDVYLFNNAGIIELNEQEL